jgi:hypothetical protein
MLFEPVINVMPIPKILAILYRGYKIEANWMTDHINLAKEHWKNKCFIVSS